MAWTVSAFGGSATSEKIWHWLFRVLMIAVACGTSSCLTADLKSEIEDLELQGNRAFETSLIHRALEKDVVIRRLSNLRIAGQSLAEGAATRILSGYQSHGYLDATVTASGVEPDLKITILEGPCYRCGSVKVVGYTGSIGRLNEYTALSHQLPLMLLSTSRDFRTPVFARDGSISKQFLATWTPGAACGDLQSTVAAAKTSVALWLDQQGYWFAKSNVLIEKDATSGNANLMIEVSDLGDRLLISEVKVEGPVQNSAQQVLDYLKLPQPLMYSESVRRQMIDCLEASGRFQSVEVRPEIPFGPGQPVPLTISVVECAGFPLLNEPLSPEQEAVLRLSRWINDWTETDDDLVIHAIHYPAALSDKAVESVYGVSSFLTQIAFGDKSAKQVHLELTLRPSGGGLMHLQSQSLAGEWQPRRTLVVSPGLSGMIFEDTKRAFRMESLKSGLAAGFTLQSRREGEVFDSAYNFSFSMDSGRRPEFELGLRFPVASVLSEIESIEVASHDAGVMQARFYSNSATVDFDAESGRMLTMHLGDEDTTVTLETVPGALNRQLPTIENLFDDESSEDESQAITKLSQMLILQYASELKRSGHPDDAGLILSLFESQAWDQLLKDLAAASPPGQFIIPAPGTAGGSVQDGLLSQATAAYSNASQLAAGQCLPAHGLNPGDTLSDQEVIALLSSTVNESPQFDAISRFAISFLRSLTPGETERLAEIIEKGEILDIGNGVNLRPLFIIVQSATSDDHRSIRDQVIAVTWQTMLKHRVRHTVVSDGNGGSQFRWELKKGNQGREQAPVANLIRNVSLPQTESIPAGDDLKSIVDDVLRNAETGFRLTRPDSFGPEPGTSGK